MRNVPYIKQTDEQGLPIEHNGISHKYPNRQERRRLLKMYNSNTILQKIGDKNIFHEKPQKIKRAIFDAGVAAEIERSKINRNLNQQ